MFAVIFEVMPRQERFDDYLEIAKRLKPEIEKIDGFLDNERFSSQRRPGTVLSLSTWRDEKAVIRWRTLGAHHVAQERGRFEVFADYHLRVGEVTADTDLPQGGALPQQRLDETEIGAAKMATIYEPPIDSAAAGDDPATALGLPPIGQGGIVDLDTFDSITTAGKRLLLISWANQAAAEAWQRRLGGSRRGRVRQVRIIRDYGMFDRREAPQFYPAVKPPSRAP